MYTTTSAHSLLTAIFAVIVKMSKVNIKLMVYNVCAMRSITN